MGHFQKVCKRGQLRVKKAAMEFEPDKVKEELANFAFNQIFADLPPTMDEDEFVEEEASSEPEELAIINQEPLCTEKATHNKLPIPNEPAMALPQDVDRAEPAAVQEHGVDNKGVGLCDEAVPLQVRPKGGWESKDYSPFVRLPKKVCT